MGWFDKPGEWVNKVGDFFGESVKFNDLKDKLGDELDEAFEKLPKEFMQAAGFSDLPDKDLMRLVESVAMRNTLDHADQIKSVLEAFRPDIAGFASPQAIAQLSGMYRGMNSFAARGDAGQVFSLFGKLADPDRIIKVVGALENVVDFDFDTPSTSPGAQSAGTLLKQKLKDFPGDALTNISALEKSVSSYISTPTSNILEQLTEGDANGGIQNAVINPLIDALPDKVFAMAAQAVSAQQFTDTLSKVSSATTDFNSALPSTTTAQGVSQGAYDPTFDYAEQTKLGQAALSLAIAKDLVTFLKAAINHFNELLSFTVSIEGGANAGSNVGGQGGAAAVVNAALQVQVPILGKGGGSVELGSLVKAATFLAEIALDILELLLSVAASVVDMHRTAPADVYKLLNDSLKQQS